MNFEALNFPPPLSWEDLNYQWLPGLSNHPIFVLQETEKDTQHHRQLCAPTLIDSKQ